MPYEVKRILFADDSSITRVTMLEVLVNHGFQRDLIDVVTDGQYAVEKLDSGQQYDLVITDLSMPIMSGFVLLKWIRNDERFVDLPVIVCSLGAVTVIIQAIKKLRAFFVDKRDLPGKLIDTINRIKAGELRPTAK